MPSYSAEVKKYLITHCAGGKYAYAHRALVVLQGDDGSTVGVAYFHRDPTTMPSKDAIKSIVVDDVPTTYAECHYRWEDFLHVVDLLRHEKPVYVRHGALGGLPFSTLSTSDEPIGEAEI